MPVSPSAQPSRASAQPNRASAQPSRASLAPLAVDRGCGEPVSLGTSLRAGKKVWPDILRLLAEDHRTVKGWVDWYRTESLPHRRAWIAANIVKVLTAHMAIEEEIFYPAAQEVIRADGLVDRAIAEHAAAKRIIDRMAGTGADTDSLMAELGAAIDKHVEQEETELFALVRESSLDQYEIGALCAARRTELLFELSAARKEPLKEMPAMPISQEDARELFVAGLRNIHGTAQQGRSMMQSQETRVASYPALKAKLQSHLREKDAQLKRVETILEQLGESTSVIKDATGAVTGAVAGVASSMMAAVADDEILKATFAAYGLANVEAAAYETLLTLGEAAGLAETLPPLQQSLSEERGMAAFIAENLRATGLRFLQLRSEGLAAGR
jgi:ferritin-like metal-binding protein YciE